MWEGKLSVSEMSKGNFLRRICPRGNVRIPIAYTVTTTLSTNTVAVSAHQFL